MTGNALVALLLCLAAPAGAAAGMAPQPPLDTAAPVTAPAEALNADLVAAPVPRMSIARRCTSVAPSRRMVTACAQIPPQAVSSRVNAPAAGLDGRTLALGTWGGTGARLRVRESGAYFEFNCALGQVDGPFEVDEDGSFEVEGTFVFERGGPVSRNRPKAVVHPARYHGSTDGHRMELTVTLVDMDRQFGPFSLEFGRWALLDKCV